MGRTKKKLFLSLLRPLFLIVFASNVLAVDQVRMGVYSNPPKIFLNEDELPSGYFGFLAQAISKKEKWQLVPVPCVWDRCLQMLENGEIDLMPDVAYSSERAKLFVFSKQVALANWSAVYAPESAQIETILDLDGKRVALIRGGIQEATIFPYLRSFGITTELLPVQNSEQAFEAVNKGGANAAIVNRLYGDFNVTKHNLERTNILLQPSSLYFTASHRADPSILRAFDHYLELWRHQPDSPYHQAAKWLEPPPEPISPWIIAAGALILLTVLAWLVWFTRMAKSKAREEVLNSRAELKGVLENMLDVYYRTDAQGRFTFLSPSIQQFGWEPKDLLGTPVADLYSDSEGREKFVRAMNASSGIVRGYEAELNMRNGKVWVSTSARYRYDDSGEVIGVEGSVRDITERKKNENQIEQLAYRDQLTGLPNRTLLLDRLTLSLTAARRHGRFGAVLFVDLDQFKSINDVHGHPVGDSVLQEIAQRLLIYLRTDDTVSRFGGDEFVILLPELSKEQKTAADLALSVGSKVLGALEAPVLIDDQQYQITASIGISLFPKQGESVDDLIREADIAMYRAKEAGGNTLIFFERNMQTRIAERYELQKDLSNAVEQGEFELFLQSQVTEEGKVVGAEGLVRWRHPTRGLMSPASFILLAEETGLIVDIGEWVLQEACRLLAHLTESGHSMRLSVNVSPRQFHQKDFVSRIREILAETGADPLYLTLEVTENLLVDQTTDVVSRMVELAELGIRFSIDDFGTGYSSLAYIKRLPLNELKIDKSFVNELPDDLNDVALVGTILSMASHLHFEVVAEGVENEAQLEFLKSLGCKCFQGYYFHRPQSSQAWVEHLG